MQQGDTNIFPANLLEAMNALVDRLNESTSSPSVRVLLISTNEGVSLTRCYGSTHEPTESPMREDTLNSIETAWATLPSGCPPQVLASHYDNNFQQPAHPLLKPIGLGETVKTVTAFYDHTTLIHFHLPPLVVTILATPQVNVNIIQSVALPILTLLLEPVAQAIVSLRKENASYSNLQQQKGAQPTTVNR